VFPRARICVFVTDASAQDGCDQAAAYDATRLFRDDVRARRSARTKASLRLRRMELGMSSPDIVGVRIPHPVPPAFEPFLIPARGG